MKGVGVTYATTLMGVDHTVSASLQAAWVTRVLTRGTAAPGPGDVPVLADGFMLVFDLAEPRFDAVELP